LLVQQDRQAQQALKVIRLRAQLVLLVILGLRVRKAFKAHKVLLGQQAHRERRASKAHKGQQAALVQLDLLVLHQP
jgi:hypothetical protein